MKEAEDMYLRALAGLVVGKIWDGMRPLTPIPLWVGMGFYWYRPMGRGISGISHGMWLNVAET